MGDIVLALPVLSALRKSFPQSKISWFIRTEFAPLIHDHPYLDDIILFDRKFLGKCWYNPKAFTALISLILQLRRSRFDMIIDLQGLFRTAAFGWLSGCRRRFGMTNAREFARLFYTHRIRQNRQYIHLVDYCLKIAASAGCSDTTVEFVLPTAPQAKENIDNLLKDRNIECGNYAVFVPGSAHPDKCWPVQRFAKLAEKLSSHFDLPVVVSGTKSEQPLAEQIITAAGVPVTNLAGMTGIRELTALLGNARLVISNDTGPGHIAAALGVPMVMIFGRSNPARVAPYGRADCIAAVAPYDRDFRADNFEAKYDIRNITVNEVFQKICKQLEQNNSL